MITLSQAAQVLNDLFLIRKTHKICVTLRNLRIMKFKIINPLTYPGWDDLLLSNSGYSFFHSSSWARVLHESYQFEPLYFTVIKDNKLLALIPFMEVKNLISGKKGVSLPFTDYVDPIVAEGNHINDVFDLLIEYGKKSGWKSIEIRGGERLFQESSPSSQYYGHTLDLSQGEDQIFSNFRDSTRRNIKKAIKADMKVDVCNTIESVTQFYRLNCMTRKMHGLPPQPGFFFKNIFEYIISKNLGFVVLASYKKEIIAGAIYFHFGEKVIYKYGASDMRFQQLRSNNLVMWHAIKYYCQNGYKKLCFGKTELEHKGLIQFKNGWGAKEHMIKYYKYDLRNNRFVEGDTLVSGFHNKIFNKTPIPILKAFGNLFYKYMG